MGSDVYKRQRQEAAESMLQFIQTAPQAAQSVLDLIAKNMDWPGADEFAERFKKQLPPNLAPETDDPEEQQARQMAAQQAQEQDAIQKRGIAAEIAEKEGKAAKMQAETLKTEAETVQTQIENMMQSGAISQMVEQAVQAQLAALLQPQPQPMPTMMGPPLQGGF